MLSSLATKAAASDLQAKNSNSSKNLYLIRLIFSLKSTHLGCSRPPARIGSSTCFAQDKRPYQSILLTVQVSVSYLRTSTTGRADLEGNDVNMKMCTHPDLGSKWPTSCAYPELHNRMCLPGSHCLSQNMGSPHGRDGIIFSLDSATNLPARGLLRRHI